MGIEKLQLVFFILFYFLGFLGLKKHLIIKSSEQIIINVIISCRDSKN